MLHSRAKPKSSICSLYKWADTAFWLRRAAQFLDTYTMAGGISRHVVENCQSTAVILLWCRAQHFPANTKHLSNICTTSAQHFRRLGGEWGLRTCSIRTNLKPVLIRTRSVQTRTGLTKPSNLPGWRFGRLNLKPVCQTRCFTDSNYLIWNRIVKSDGFSVSNYFQIGVIRLYNVFTTFICV